MPVNPLRHQDHRENKSKVSTSMVQCANIEGHCYVSQQLFAKFLPPKEKQATTTDHEFLMKLATERFHEQHISEFFIKIIHKEAALTTTAMTLRNLIYHFQAVNRKVIFGTKKRLMK